MPYPINKQVDRGEWARYHRAEFHYMDALRKKGLLIEMDNILVDAEQLVLRTFRCNSNYCLRCVGSGSSREYRGSCCTDLQVEITHEEKEKFLELARIARKKLKLKKSDPLNDVLRRLLNDNFSEVNDEHEEVLKHLRNERCALSHLDSNGQLRCSINTMTERLGLPIHEYKADPCFLFPLHYSEFEKEQYLVSLLTEETRYWIEQHKCVGKLRCLGKPEPGVPPAYVTLAYEIEYVFGKRFYRDLKKRAEPILEKHLARTSANGARRPGAAAVAG